ncbi:MAG: DUF4231 domain-containing protein [Candidatus Aminicenantes bacterium]|nr:DUF4231 domain-containing protein [Candidatus Aminicenantes bacterium]
MNQTQKKEKSFILEHAWQHFALYEKNASLQKSSANRMQVWVLMLGGLAAFLAVLRSQLLSGANPVLVADGIPDRLLHYAIIIFPIATTVLAAIFNRFKPGSKWTPLRNAAERIKSEIFRYRTLRSYDAKTGDEQPGSDKNLEGAIIDINDRLMKTDVNQTALRPYKGEIPPSTYGVAEDSDVFSQLTPAQYLTVRLDDQLTFYKKKTESLEKKLKFFHALIYIFGGLGTFLAAVGLEIWVAVTTSFAGIYTTLLEYKQIENNLMIYNQAASSLSNLKTWWLALPEEKKKEEQVRTLVDGVEKILHSEQSRWIGNMEAVLEKLRVERTSEESAGA